MRNTFLALLLAAAPLAAFAQVQYSYADVVSVRPIYSQVCGNQSYGYEQPQYEQQPRSRTAPVLGAIVGAAAGNQIGGGSVRDAATAAGAILGYSVTRDAQERNRYNERNRYPHRQSRQVCSERVDGYDVWFRTSQGTFQTTLPYNPGRTVRIRTEIIVEDAIG